MIVTELASISALQIDPADGVAVALRDLGAGETIAVAGQTIRLKDPIPRGHKFALAGIAPGEAVMKYGWPIGHATAPIAIGEHVHSHNLVTGLRGHHQYEYRPASAQRAETDMAPGFMGYLRANGSVGTRNEIWILCTVGCVARTTERIAQEASRRFAGRVDGIYALTHPFGCSQLGDDLGNTRHILASLAAHPNAGGVLIVGLGCESNQLDQLLKETQRDPERLRSFNAQTASDEVEDGIAAVEALVRIAEQDRRTLRPLGDLVVGLKCGGSDGFSGLSANPLVGRIADRVAGAGGTPILTEIPEIFGAENILMSRAADRNIFDGIVGLVTSFKNYFIAQGEPISENPSPGNVAGGITTLEEKSLGAVQKAGHTIFHQVIAYGGRVNRKGAALLGAPGNDAVSSTALAAAGATIILFTTGRGTPLGFAVPTLKLSTNSPLAKAKPHWIDFDGGQVLTGMPMERAADELMRLVVETASGAATHAERNGERQMAIWKTGVTL